MSKRDLEGKTGQFLNFWMQYMIPSELDIHNSLYQEFLCLILFWCSCIATGEKEVYTGKMTLLESVKSVFTEGVQLVLPGEPPS